MQEMGNDALVSLDGTLANVRFEVVRLDARDVGKEAGNLGVVRKARRNELAKVARHVVLPDLRRNAVADCGTNARPQ